MKLFGHFLVEQGMISREDLVNALITQLSESPTMAGAMQSLGLLSDEQIMQVFDIQHKNKSEFSTACKEAGFWDGDIQRKVNEYVAANRRPLGGILYAQGKVTTSQLAHALDEYSVECDSDKESEKNRTNDGAGAEVPDSSGAIEVAEESAEALGAVGRSTGSNARNVPTTAANVAADAAGGKSRFVFVDAKIDSGLLEQFLGIFTDEMHQDLTERINCLGATPDEIRSQGEGLLEAVLPVVASAKFIRACLTAKLMVEVEDLLEKLLDGVVEIVLAKELLKKSLFSAWQLRNHLLSANSEAAIWHDEIFRENYLVLISEIEVFTHAVKAA